MAVAIAFTFLPLATLHFAFADVTSVLTFLHGVVATYRFSLSLFVSFSDVILFSGRIRVHSTILHHWGFQASKNNLIQICYAKKEDKIEQLEIDF